MTNCKIDLRLGDCLEILPTLPDNIADIFIMDPPWNVGKDYGKYKDNLTYEEYTQFINILQDLCEHKAGGRTAIVLGSEILKQWWDEYPEAKIIIVRLGAIVLTRKNNMHLQWKPILTNCVSNEFSTDLWEDIRWPGEGYFFNEPRYGHPCMTPLKLMKRLILRFTEPGDTVIDPFLGVGTTAVACLQTGRNIIGIEMNEDYLDTAKKRIAEAQLQIRMEL